jgi:2-dehydro-3-deoxygluconokinase
MAVICFGEILLRLSAPSREPLLQSPNFLACFGGAEANVAVALVHLGDSARVATTLPENAIGTACLVELRRHGVDVSAVRCDSGRMGLYFYTTGASFRPARVLYDRANSAFAAADSARYDWPKILAGASWLHSSGITPAVSAMAHRSLIAAVAAAGARNVPVSFDCNIRASLWQGREHEAAEALRPIARQAQLLVATPLDIAALFGADLENLRGEAAFRRAADTAFTACPNLKILASTERITRHAECQSLGGFAADRKSFAASRAYELDPLIERIGGGDAFAAGFLHALGQGSNLQRCIDFATATAVLKHTLPGDFFTLSVADVNALLTDGGMDIKR